MSSSLPKKLSPEETLTAAGLRRTPMRIALLKLLASSPQPLSAPEIVPRLPRGADTVTVYRTLNTFTDARLVHRIRSEDRSWRYALGAQQPHKSHQHPHFVCDECGNVECLAASKVPDSLVPSLRVARDHQVKFPEVILHGVCPRCV